ncbi:SDR family oxidoreductase [Actinomadura spongiicola]|nr:SDR family oxidoreductase [Actinomadura spongiicola]
MTVWVEGATGKAGRRVVRALADAGVPVRAASRHPGAPSRGVVPVRFDWYDPSTWSSALGDADALFLKGLDADDDAAEVMTRLIAAAPNVRHVVLMSAVGVDRAPDETPRRAVESAVQNSGRRWTILRPNWFLQNFDEDEWVFAKALREEGALYASAGRSEVGFVDTRDIADAAVTVLTHDGHHGRGYTLTGPESVTFGHVADTLSKASGRPITHVDATPDQHRAYFARSGLSEDWVEHMVDLFALVRANVFARVSDDYQELTGNPPRTLEAYAKEMWSR